MPSRAAVRRSISTVIFAVVCGVVTLVNAETPISDPIPEPRVASGAGRIESSLSAWWYDPISAIGEALAAAARKL